MGNIVQIQATFVLDKNALDYDNLLDDDIRCKALDGLIVWKIVETEKKTIVYYIYSDDGEE